MKILITGNMGYVGSVLTNYLKSNLKNSQLCGLDTGYFAHNNTSSNFLPEINLDKQYFFDIRNIPDNLLDGIDSIIHLSALSNDPIGQKFNRVTKKINVDASIDLFNLAVKKNIKNFVFASSCSVYGQSKNKFVNESSFVEPLTAYARSKVEFENYIISKSNNIKVTSLRFATACGASDRLRLDLVLNDFVVSAIKNKKIEILSRGDQWRPFIDVEDMARAIHWAVVRKNGNKKLIVNAGSNKLNLKIKDLALNIKKIIKNVDVKTNKNAPADNRSYAVNFDLFKKLAPKFQPKNSLKKIFLNLIKNINNLNTDKNFRKSDLVRLQMLENHITKKRLDKNLFWKF